MDDQCCLTARTERDFSLMVDEERKKIHGAGKSSFGLVDQNILFSKLGLSRGITFMDIGCGRGDYAIVAAEIIGPGGLVYGIDLWQEGIIALEEKASARGIRNIKAMVADAGKILLVKDHTVDFCFMATVFHDLVLANSSEGALREISRVLKAEGMMAILEFKKIDGPPGPPITSRLDSQEVEERVIPHGFARISLTEIEPYTYLMLFRKR